MPFNFVAQALEQRQQQHLMRTRKNVVRVNAGRLEHNGRQFLDFSSNDYLAMSHHPEVVQSAKDAIERFGVGSGGSSMITGYNNAQVALEEYLADWLGYERCMLFGSGFAANTGVIETLMTHKEDLLVQDKLNHASLIDGGLHCKAKSLRYQHNDLSVLQQRLQADSQNKLVVTEGIFSMDGDTGHLNSIAQLSESAGAALMVDDAHGLGVLGEKGKGTPNHFGLTAKDVDIHMATFGKAVGTGGAFVAGSAQTIEYLLQFCRHYTYSTAMPPALACATLTSLKIISQEQWRRDKLNKLIERFKANMQSLDLPDNHSNSAIQPIVVGESEKALAISQALNESGIWLSAIREPTVPKGTARLRVTLNCQHSEADIDFLFEQLGVLL